MAFRILLLTFVACVWAAAQHPSGKSNKISDIPFAEIGPRTLALDLYLPSVDEPPLVVYVHGGAWRRGSKTSMPLQALVQAGYAVASVEYRLSPEARFPAQVHDIKAAIRFLRASRSEYGYSTDFIAISGSSAGAHLAALVGVSNGHSGLEGQVGNHLGESSDVHAIVSYFGASNLTSILSQSTPHGIGVRVPALQLLLGGQPERKPELARLASPLFHVDEADPPLLLLHGDQDYQMPINQSHELAGAYGKLSIPVDLEVVHGAGHGGKPFYDAARTAKVHAFLERHRP